MERAETTAASLDHTIDLSLVYMARDERQECDAITYRERLKEELREVLFKVRNAEERRRA